MTKKKKNNMIADFFSEYYIQKITILLVIVLVMTVVVFNLSKMYFFENSQDSVEYDQLRKLSCFSAESTGGCSVFLNESLVTVDECCEEFDKCCS